MSRNYNGLERQNAIINQFKRDAKSSNANSAVAQAIKNAKASKLAYREQELEAAKAPAFVYGSPAHREWLNSRKK